MVLPNFSISVQALDQACRELELEWRIEIRYSSRRGKRRGSHSLYRDTEGLVHDIMLKSYLTHEQASRTLRHELRHAWQAEQAGGALEWREVRQEARIRRPGNNYQTRSIEMDARQYAHQDHPPLAY